jgi:hypothetical protein
MEGNDIIGFGDYATDEAGIIKIIERWDNRFTGLEVQHRNFKFDFEGSTGMVSFEFRNNSLLKWRQEEYIIFKMEPISC